MKTHTCRNSCYLLLVLVVITGFSGKGWAQSARSVTIPLTFEPNMGQVKRPALFVARTGHGQALLTKNGLVLPGSGQGANPVRVQFLHSQRTMAEGERPTGGVANYYATQDRRNWHAGIPMYSRVRYREIYPGIDAVFHGRADNDLEFDFELEPGRSPNEVAIMVNGADKLELAGDGSLEIHAGSQSWRLPVPEAYQTPGGLQSQVFARYVITAPYTFKIKTGSYDPRYPLIIDPVVEYARVIGLDNTTAVAAMQVDSQGNLIIAGSTFATDFPVVNGQQGKFPSGSEQVFLTKLNPAGDTILFSTFIPASGFSSARALVLDAQGNSYLAGFAGASDFPVTSSNLGSCTQFCNAGFVAKFNPFGALSYSTLLGSGQVLPRAIAVDGNGSAYVTGNADFTLQTVNAFQPGCPTCSGAFFAKLDLAGANFIFASYFATLNATGTVGKGIALDAAGNILIAGDGFTPPLLNPWQIGGSLYLAKFAPDGQTLLFSTELGTGGESLTGMHVGADGTVFLAGTAQNNDYPYAIDAARHPEGPGGNSHIFASAVNPALTGFTYSTYIADGNLEATFLDGSGALFLAGSLGGQLPLQNAVVSDVKTPGTGFFTKVDAFGHPVTSSLFGGHLTQEVPTGIAADAAGNIYIAGTVSAQNENPQPDPVLVGASISTGLSGGNDGLFFAKVNPANLPQISLDTTVPPFLFLRNAGTADLHVSSMSFSGGRISGNCGTAVPAGSSCVVTVSSSAGGLAPGTITITSDAEPAVQTFHIALFPTQRAGAPIGDFLWSDDDRAFLPLGGQTIPFRLWNVGTADLVINLVTVSSPAFQTNDCGVGLAPGASCTISVTLSANSTLITVFFDNGAQKTFSFFSTPVNQNPVLSVTGIRYPTQFVGGVALPRTVTVTNAGAGDVSVSPVLTGDPEFAIIGNTCPISLPAHQSCVVGVQFTPSIDGNRSAVLTINGSNVQLFAQGEINSAVQVSPLQQDFFPTVVHLQSETFPVTLTNTAPSPLPITGIVFSLADYTETDDCAGQVPGNGTCTIQVTFVPQAVGARNGTMTVGFTGATTQVLTLTGTGQTPFLVDPQVLNFTAAVGNSSPEQGISIGSRLATSEGYTFAVTGDFAIAQNPCPSPMPRNGTIGCAPTIVFRPTSPGTKQGTFTVSYAGIAEQDVVTLNGTVTAVAASPLQLNFPVTKVTTSAILDVTLTNGGTTPAPIASIITAPPFGESDGCQGVVPANGTCVLHVSFSPQVTFPVNGTMDITLADGGRYSVALSGTGTGPVISILAVGGTNFSDQVVGTTSNNPITVSVVNNGNAPLNITAISITGDFSQTNNCPVSLVSSCQINVKFAPKATGSHTGVLALADDGLGSPQILQFSGTGTDFQISTTGSGSSASVAAGQTAAYSLAFSAVGSFSGQVQVDCSGAPPQGSCSLSSPNVNLIGSVPVPLTVTVSTAPHTSAAASIPQQRSARMNMIAGLLLLPMLFISRRLRRSVACRSIVVLAILGSMMMLASCGGGGGSQGVPPPPLTQGGTPAGTYTITVTATDQTINGPVVHQTTLSLKVQ